MYIPDLVATLHITPLPLALQGAVFFTAGEEALLGTSGITNNSFSL